MTIGFAEKEDYKSVEQLYFDAFPRHERLPFFMLKKRLKTGKSELIIAKGNGKVIAFAYILLYKDIAYLFYFAVLSSFRNKGIGSLFIKYIKEQYHDKRIILAVEQPDSKAENNIFRIKRKTFYLKNGFREQKCKITEGNVQFDVLGIGDDISKIEYTNMFYFWGGKSFFLFLKIIITESES